MLPIRIIPCLLLKNEGLVKTLKFNKPKYVGDPLNAVKIFNEKGADELILLDITASFDKKKPDFIFLSKIASECFMPVAYGGGINNLDDVKKIFNLGIEKIVVNTYAVENPPFIRDVSRLYGNQSVIVSIDVKKNIFGKYEAFIYGGRKNTKLDPADLAKQMQDMGAGEIFLTSVDRDGTMKGYDIELIKKVAHSVSIPVIACGGAGKIDDFVKAVTEGAASAIAAGSMFVFQGEDRAILITYPSEKEIEGLLTHSKRYA